MMPDFTTVLAPILKECEIDACPIPEYQITWFKGVMGKLDKIAEMAFGKIAEAAGATPEDMADCPIGPKFLAGLYRKIFSGYLDSLDKREDGLYYVNIEKMVEAAMKTAGELDGILKARYPENESFDMDDDDFTVSEEHGIPSVPREEG